MSDENKGYRYEYRYLNEEERYNINHEFSQMLFRYKYYLHIPRKSVIDENITLHATDTGILMLFVEEKNKKGITTFNYMFIR